MEMKFEPLIKLGTPEATKGGVPVLSYNVPEPTSYTGENIIEIDLIPNGQNAAMYFKPECLAFVVPTEPVEPVTDEEIAAGVGEIKRDGSNISDEGRKAIARIRDAIIQGLGTTILGGRIFDNVIHYDIVKKILADDIRNGRTDLINVNTVDPVTINNIIARLETPSDQLNSTVGFFNTDVAVAEVLKGNKIVARQQISGNITYDILPQNQVSRFTTADAIGSTAAKATTVNAAEIASRAPNLSFNLQDATSVNNLRSEVQAKAQEVFIERAPHGTIEIDYGYYLNLPPEKIKDISILPPRFMLIETYRLSSFAGSYGAGRTVSTFSLLPGEKSTISIRTYSKSEETQKKASSIFDSYTEDCVDAFESSVQNEMSNAASMASMKQYNDCVTAASTSSSISDYSKTSVSAKATGKLGFCKVSGTANVNVSSESMHDENTSADYSSSSEMGMTNSAREEFAKNVQNATSKHANEASTRRDVQVNTSSEVTKIEGEESATEREISNINTNCTLNFVFRQMNQEFISILHLTDIRIAFIHGNGRYIGGYTLPELDNLLDAYALPEKKNQLRKTIIDQLLCIKDYLDEQPKGFDKDGKPVDKPFIQKKVYLDENKKQIGNPYYQFSKDRYSKYSDANMNDREILVKGIIVSVDTNVLRTDGIVVDTILGQGVAVDSYNLDKQTEEIREMKLRNDLMETEITRRKCLNVILEEGDAEKAKLVECLYQPCRIHDGNKEMVTQ